RAGGSRRQPRRASAGRDALRSPRGLMGTLRARVVTLWRSGACRCHRCHHAACTPRHADGHLRAVGVVRTPCPFAAPPAPVGSPGGAAISLGHTRGQTTESPGMDRDWVRRSACKGLDPTIFYPATDEEADEAKAVCAQCPVQEECLEHAIGHREHNGVWGGATERER